MIVLPVIIESIASRKDKTVSLRLGTQELAPTQASEIFMLNQQFCYMAIKKENFQDNEIEIMSLLKADMENQKTPSQRLRSILYRNFEQKDEGYKDFTTYYLSKMDKICEHYKSKLDG